MKDLRFRDNPTWFIDRLALYQNANSSPEAIKRGFLIRIAEYELIMDDIRSRMKSGPMQHELILGRRGSGKSTLLRRIQIEIDEQPDLAEHLVAINLAEEQNAIYRLSDLWFEVLEELAIRFKVTLNLAAFDTFEDNHAYTRYLYAEIHRLLKAHQKRVVLLLDNLDRILENFDDEAHLLRETLLNYQDIQLIGGSTRMSEHYWQYDKPFYDFFRRYRLPGLTFEEIHRLLNAWADEMELPELHDYALRYRGRIEAIRILTDGLPRALQYFIQVLLHDSELYGFDYLRKVMDKATPLYQERLNSLTAPQRKIVQEMAFCWEAAPTKILVERCRMESKTISSFLKQLDHFGIVETLSTGKKNHLYRLSERFFNMWLIVTQGNPDQKRRAKYLTLFLEAWYDEQDLRSLVEKHLTDLKGKKLSFDKAMVLSKGLAQSKYMTTEQRDELIDLTLALKPEGVMETELPRPFREIGKEIVKLEESGQYEQMLIKLDEIENEADGLKFCAKAICLSKLGKNNDAEKYYLLAIEKENIDALNNMAVLYENQGKYADAEKYYLRAIEKESVRALNNLALLYAKQGKYTEAEKHYLLAIEKENVAALNNLAVLYSNQKKYVDAEKYYQLAIERGNEDALNNLAVLYDNHEKYADAEKSYLLAIEKGNVSALNNLAHLYWDQNTHPKQALEYIHKYHDLKKGNESQLTQLLIEIWNGIFEKVPERIEKILEDAKEEDVAWFWEGLLYHHQVQLVLSLFESEKHGPSLRERYVLLYYAALLLAGHTEDNLLLRIPPEVMPTVNEMVEKIRERQALYAQGPRAGFEEGK